MKIVDILEADFIFEEYTNLHGYGIDDIRDYPEDELAVGIQSRANDTLVARYVFRRGRIITICETKNWYDWDDRGITSLLKQGMSLTDIFAFYDL